LNEVDDFIVDDECFIEDDNDDNNEVFVVDDDSDDDKENFIKPRQTCMYNYTNNVYTRN